MPVTEQVQEVVKGGNRNTAIAAAAAAAATGAATYAVRRARSHDGLSLGSGKHGASSILSSAAQSSWEATADVLVPIVEDAAASAGKYVAEHGSDFVKDHLVPRFIEAFNDAK
jgi:dihydroxyacetone kinase